jgi:hypothetical protein
MGGGQHAAEHVVWHRVGPKSRPDVAALPDDAVDSRTLFGRVRLRAPLVRNRLRRGLIVGMRVDFSPP